MLDVSNAQESEFQQFSGLISLKCDEQKPSCKRCRTNDRTCAYTATVRRSQQSRETSALSNDAVIDNGGNRAAFASSPLHDLDTILNFDMFTLPTTIAEENLAAQTTDVSTHHPDAMALFNP